jgi:hypothetical protein
MEAQHMKTTPLPTHTQHASATSRSGQASAANNGKPAATANGFAQMLLDGLGENLESTGLNLSDATSLDSGVTPDNAGNDTTDTDVSQLAVADPLALATNPTQVVMAMLAPVAGHGVQPPAKPSSDTLFTPSGHPLPSQATATGLESTLATPSNATHTDLPTLTSKTQATTEQTLPPEALFTPSGHPLPSQATATGLQGTVTSPSNAAVVWRTDQVSDEPTTVVTAVTKDGKPTTQAQQRPEASMPVATTPVYAPQTTQEQPTVGRRVSAATKDHTLSGPPPLSLASVQGLESTVSWHMATPGQPGSALAAPPEATPTSSEPLNAANGSLQRESSAKQDESSHDPSGQNPLLQTQDAATNSSNHASATDNANAPTDGFAMSLGEAMGDAFETLGAQVSFWAAQNTKRASVNLDAGLDSPLTVDVALDQGQVQIAFRTDDATAQAAIKSHAQAVLGDLLARSGIGLAGLSVGSQASQGQNQQHAQGQNGWPGLHRALDRVAGSEAPSSTPRVTTLSNARGLDVYA